MGESEVCMKSIQTFEETGDADKAIATVEAKEKSKAQKSTVSSNLRTRSGNTYFNLDSKSDEENSSEILNGTFLPESVVQTNIRQQNKQQPIRRTMITRSLSNMSNSSGKTKAYYSTENKNVAKKSSIKNRKHSTRYNPEEEGMSPDERERLRIRRQR